jgi:D-lactate dehydrogenase
LCCGQPFASKGFPEAASTILKRTAQALLAAAGTHSILVSDTSTCAAHLDHAAELLDGTERQRWLQLRRLAPAAVMQEILLPRLQAAGRLPSIGVPLVVHPTCSEHRHGWVTGLTEAVDHLGTAILPASAGCCGMAGDKGWSMPALTAGATQREAAEKTGAGVGITTSTTCGLAMEAATGLPYRHLFQAVAVRITPK